MPLVSYSSDTDSDETGPTGQVLTPSAVSTRKRTLPSLPIAFPSGEGPNDDPTLHQGRKRTRPYIDGDHDTHIYISLEIPKKLSVDIDKLAKRIQETRPELELHNYLSTSTELHVSLSHAFPLRRSQIPQFTSDFRRNLLEYGKRFGSLGGLKLSLGGKVRVYHNGKRYGGEGHGGRAFLALQVGAGAKQIDGIVQAVIHPLLQTLHRPLYHSDPEYHASFAWCLVGSPELSSSQMLEDNSLDASERSEPFDPALILELNDQFEKLLLSSQPTSGWTIDHIVLKIGKEITRCPLE